jgi:tetratricopeptide (TPR) repeat protein
MREIVGTRGGQNQEMAQQLVYDAMDANTPERMAALVAQALKLDPENVDALSMMARMAGFEGEQRIEFLRTIVERGAKRLGKKAFKDLVPHFWGFLETRPYMRARQELAEELRAAGRFEEAAAEYAEMLALNENDNQGVRYHHLPCLMALNRLDDARSLMKRYKDDVKWNTVFAWCHVLERVLSGDEPGAQKALAAAREQNGFTEAYVKGHRKLPRSLPPHYAPNSKEEAQCYAEPLLMAWRAHAEAQKWLEAQRNDGA